MIIWSLFNRNDIVVFDHDNSKLIKRIIALPGETIEYKDGILYINDRKYDDKFASITENFDLTDFGIQKLPENSYFLLGDYHWLLYTVNGNN